MTDHDQTTLELMRSRNSNTQLWTIVFALSAALVITCASFALQSFMRGRDIAALTAKCGLERP